MIARILVGAAIGLTLSGAAFAQSYNAPAGIPSATAPGGLDGVAGAGNAARYYERSGRAVGAPYDGVYTTGTITMVPIVPRHSAR